MKAAPNRRHVRSAVAVLGLRREYTERACLPQHGPCRQEIRCVLLVNRKWPLENPELLGASPSHVYTLLSAHPSLRIPKALHFYVSSSNPFPSSSSLYTIHPIPSPPHPYPTPSTIITAIGLQVIEYKMLWVGYLLLSQNEVMSLCSWGVMNLQLSTA